VPLSRTENGALVAEVTWVDRYGNCQLNIGPDEVAGFGEQLKVEIAPVTGERVVRSMRVVRAFAEIGGGVGLVVDSFGMLAVCVDRGSAAAELSLATGDSVHISASPEGSSSATGITTPVTLRR
jgi:S-adenosylmethionine hydrolase